MIDRDRERMKNYAYRQFVDAVALAPKAAYCSATSQKSAKKRGPVSRFISQCSELLSEFWAWCDTDAAKNAVVAFVVGWIACAWFYG